MKVRLLTAFAGTIGGHDSPPGGTTLDVADELGRALCDDGRAEAVDPSPSKVERAVAPPQKRGK